MSASTYMPETVVLNGQPGIWLDWQSETWLHRGHVTAEDINHHLEASEPLDAIAVVPGSLRHDWMRFTTGNPGGDYDDDDVSLRWESTEPGAEGAIAVTVATATSVDLIEAVS
ncbi:hypothetical protein ACFC08_17840 [Streptomyces sp. NPDC056112]|uniref:hypothetical protein n=1 Tax=Streptomyces sp. NPDC056112 TaxID=3345715 RepID=UPI0035D5F749